MKKLLIMGLAILMVLAFAACGSQDNAAEDVADDAAADVADDTADDTADDAADVAADVADDTADDVADDTVDDVADDTAEDATGDTGGEGWSVKVGDFDVTASNTLETVTQTLHKTSKDGSLEEQECTGYKIADILEAAGVTDFEKLTVVAADGFEYELAADVALLDTTMLVIEQDGEVYEIPRFAVEGEGSKAWVKDVVEIKAD